MTSGIKTAALLGGLSALFLLIGGYLGGEQGMVFAFGLAVVMNVGSYWFSDKIVLRMYRAQEVGPEHPLHRITARLAQKAGLADAAGLRDSRHVPQCVRHGPQSAARGRRRDRGHCCRRCRKVKSKASSRTSSRTCRIGTS